MKEIILSNGQRFGINVEYLQECDSKILHFYGQGKEIWKSSIFHDWVSNSFIIGDTLTDYMINNDCILIAII